MRKFTDTELELAPRVAEVMGPHEWQSGDLCYSIGHTAGRGIKKDPAKVELVSVADSPSYLHTYEHIPGLIRRSHLVPESRVKVKHTWLPLEHDCLEWLRERTRCDFYVDSWYEWAEKDRPGNWTVTPIVDKKLMEEWSADGDTLLEALYRVILEVGK